MGWQARAAGAAWAWAALAAPAGAADITAETYKAAVGPCMRANDLACAETNWGYYLRLRPTDGNAMANLGIVMNKRDNHTGAIAQFERAIDLGEGSYDLFAYYADSLAKLGRTDQAIDWSYKSLTVAPTLVDVRGKLAKLLVLQKRHYEALALLTAFDDELRAKGHPAWFEGQRIAIESALARQGAAPGVEQKSVRLPKVGNHFWVPVTLGDARPSAFVVDTGAASILMSEETLAQSKVAYKVLDASVGLYVADGRRTSGRKVRIASMKIGPYELKDAVAVACQGCAPLIGNSALSRFDIKSSKVQGVEFMSMAPRP